jgi:hypothetical protein
MLGYPNLALNSAQEALRQAHDLAHPFTPAVTLYAIATVYLFRREVQAVREPTEALLVLAREQGFRTVAIATAWQGWILAIQGQAEAGREQVHQTSQSTEAGHLEAVAP